MQSYAVLTPAEEGGYIARNPETMTDRRAPLGSYLPHRAAGRCGRAAVAAGGTRW